MIDPQITLTIINDNPDYSTRLEVIKSQSFGLYTQPLLEKMAEISEGCILAEISISGYLLGLMLIDRFEGIEQWNKSFTEVADNARKAFETVAFDLEFVSITNQIDK
jgi:hypothetical protein